MSSAFFLTIFKYGNLLFAAAVAPMLNSLSFPMSKKIVKLELANPRFSKAEIRDHASEFVLYSRYSGFVLDDFNSDLREAKLLPIKSDFNELYKLLLDTTLDNAKVLYQLTKLYPSFGNWKIKCLTPGVDITSFVFKPAKPEKKKAKKAPAKPAKKVVSNSSRKPKASKPAKPAKPAKKKSASKPAKKKTAAKKPSKKKR